MNNSLRRVPALLLLLLLCGCGRGGETAEIRYYRLASGQSANHLANQACERFCSLVEKESGGAIQIIPSFENELGTDASALEQCVCGGHRLRAHTALGGRSLCAAAFGASAAL